MDAALRRMSQAKKSKLAKERAKMTKPKQTLDAKQYAFACLGCFGLLWAFTATVLLLRMAIMYAFDTVVETRLEYSAEGAAEWARIVAEKDVGQAYEVWHLLNASILGLVYREPEDFTNLASVLAPAFDTMPSLHSVQFAYSDRLAEVYVSKRKVALSSDSSILMQSTSTECFLLGPDGCVEQLANDVHGTSRPQWYLDGERMQPGQDFTYQWAAEPRIVKEINSDDVHFFSLCISLLFRAKFPNYPATVVGQVLIKMSYLTGDRLVDNRLGDDGKIMLVDASGIMLAARNPLDLLTVDGGLVRTKKLSEVAPDCSPVVQSASSSNSIAQKQEQKSDKLIVVEPLSQSMKRFAIVVVAPSVTPFTNSPLLTTSIVSAFVGPAPYVLAITAAIAVFGSQCIYSLRHTGEAEKNGVGKRISIEDYETTTPKGWLTGLSGAEVQEVAAPRKFAVVEEENIAQKLQDMEKAQAQARMNKVMRQMKELEAYSQKAETAH